ncbi:MAG: tautomerase family protein [Chitinophagales bacterium]|nr:tautomerase family protein [Hyphomicrobiales bacterium]
MPIITVKVAALNPISNLEAQIAAIATNASTEILRKPRNLTAVLVESLNPAQWFVAGRTLQAHDKSSFWLDIRVTVGTNTKDEKAAFVATIYNKMSELLGEVHEESYVYVNEVNGDAYGFGGKTQEHRYIESKLNAA